MSEMKKGKTGLPKSSQLKPAQTGNQQRSPKPPATVYDVKTKSFVPPVIHKTVVHNVIYVNSLPANSGLTIVQQQQKHVNNDKPKNLQKTTNNNAHKAFVQQPPKIVKQPVKAASNMQSKPYVQPKTVLKQPVQPAKTILHKHKHNHEHSHTNNTPKTTQKPIVKTVVHKHVHIHEHDHTHSHRNAKK